MMILSSTIALSTARSGEPEYMKLNYQEVPAVEVKGFWDTSGVFVATDIEELPKKRLPKLRGEIQKIDKDAKTITMYGRQIKIEDRTQFLETVDEEFTIDNLQEGKRVEISCKVGGDGAWKARKIKVKLIKESNKIKGTLTGISVDGNPPDTLEIFGLLIILNRETDVNEPAGSTGAIEKYLFDELAYEDAESNSGGFTINRKLHFSIDYRHGFTGETDYDLSDRFRSDHNETEPQIRLELASYLNERFRTFARLRIRKKFFLNSDRQNPPSEDLDVRISQLYFLARNSGVTGLAIQVGRQKFDEPREWLFDEYLDAIRIYYYALQPVVFETALIHSVFPLKEKYETWIDIFGQISWHFNRKSRLRGYVLLRKDSDESRNREPVWFGAGCYANIQPLFKPWLELALLRGEDKSEKQRASALDVGATFKVMDNIFVPSITVSYAIGSGDETGGDGISNEFRQTGYEDNVDYFGGVNTMHYYGEVLDPELSNLKVLTLGLSFKPIENGSVEVIYHSYRQNHADDKLRGELVDPTGNPSGINDDIGWELDFVIGLSNLWQRVDLSWVYGLFYPGQAFNPYMEVASLNKLNLKIEL